MRSVTVRLDDLRAMILNLGFVGENEHRTFRFDCQKMFGEYPSASVSLTVQPPAGDCYPAVVERDGDLVSWTVTDSDLIEDGNGELQLTFMVGDVKAKTCIARTKVERSLGAPGQIPTPIENWIEQAEEIISDAEDAATAAWDAADHPPIIDGNGYWNTWDSEECVYVSTGVKAQGEDGDPGYSPTATVTKSGKVATISITDQNGTTTATVSDGEDGSSAIDDTSTAANKTWSAQKVSGEFSSLLTEITNAQGDVSDIKSILDIQEGSGGVIFTGDQSDDYKIQVQVSTLAVIDSSKNHSLKANVTGSTNITIKKDYSTRFIVTTFGSEPANGVIGIRRIDNAASVTDYEMVLANGENWLLITYFNDDEDASRNVTTVKNSFVITSEETGEAYSQRIDTIEEKTNKSFSALGLEGSVNLFDPNGDSANLMMTINQGSQVYTESSKVHGMYCEIPSGTTFTVEKPQSSRFVIGTSVAKPVSGGALSQIVDVSSSKVSYTLTSGANDKYFFMAYYHNDDDASKNIDTIIAGIKVFAGTVWREGTSNFLHPLSAMPGYMTKLLSYKPLGTLTKPYICLSCDDGEATLATDTIPALKGYKTTYGQNIPVTFGLLDTSPVITDQTYKALVQEMVADYGCSVAVHGAVTLTDLDEIGLQEELKKQKDALTTAGFTPNGIIYPQHSFNDLVCAVAGGQYGVCCTGGNYTDLTYGAGNACGYRSNMYALYRLSLFNSSMTTQKIHDYVDYIEANNMLMCAFWHDSSFASNHALLDELVSYAVGKGIDFITIGDILTIV